MGRKGERVLGEEGNEGGFKATWMRLTSIYVARQLDERQEDERPCEKERSMRITRQLELAANSST